MIAPKLQLPGGSGGGGGGAVDSVNGQTGVVVLDTGDISESGNLYFTDERAQDAVGNAVGAGLSYDDGTGAISSTITQYTDEMAQDAVGGILDDGGDIDFTYDDATPKITAAVKNGLPATRIANGTVSDAEFQYIGGLTSDAQTQINAKANDADVVHDTGDETVGGVKTFTSDPIIPDEAYGAGWNGSLEPPTKNAVYDKIQTMGGGGISLGLVTAINMGCGGTFYGNY